jgi:hypothetical protein
MGEALRGRAGDGGEGRRALGRRRLGARHRVLAATLTLASTTLCATPVRATPNPQQPAQIHRGRFTVVCYPSEEKLAAALVARALATDTFPGLPRPTHQVVIEIAPDARRFREWAGAGAPEWGAALAFPESRRIVMQGRSAGSDAGDPIEVLRHELAHLALHEYLGDLAPRWFDEGYASYAARELMRNELLAANFALAIRGMPSLDELDDRFTEGANSAQAAYALAYRAVDDMAAIDPRHGLTNLFRDWKATGSLDRAMRAAYGMTLAAFERDWQVRTRRRYGGLALFSDLTLGTLIVLLIVTPLYLARRRRDRRRLDAMIAADALAARSEQAVLDALLGSGGSDGASPAEPPRGEGQPDGTAGS